MQNQSRAGWARDRWSPALLLIFSLLLTFILAAFARSSIQSRNQERFENGVLDVTDSITRRFALYDLLLRSGAAFFSAEREPETADFAAYANRLRLPIDFPGIESFGYAGRVRPGEAQALAGQMRQRGIQAFRVWPDPADGAESFPVLFQEPQRRAGTNLVGYNLAASPALRLAMEIARDSGSAASTRKLEGDISLSKDTEPGFMIFTPVYSGKTIGTSIETRRNHLRGFIYATVGIEHFLSKAFSQIDPPRIDFELYDGHGAAESNLWHRSSSSKLDPDPALRKIVTINAAGRPWTILLVAPSGFKSWFDQWLTPLLLVGGLLCSLALFAIIQLQVRTRLDLERAVSRLGESEATLRENQELYLTVSETAADCIVTIDEHSTILSANHAVERIFGYAPAEVIGQKLTMLMPEPLRAAHLSGFQRFLSTGDKNIPWHGVELPGLRKDARTIPLEISFGMSVRGDRRLFTGIIRDITERKQVTEALRQSEEKFRLIVERARDYSIFTLDPDGRISGWNSGARNILGYEDVEVLGKGARMFFTPEDRAGGAPEAEMETALSEGRWLGDQWQMRKDGSRFWATGSLISLRDESGNLRGFVKIMRDMTERKKNEEAAQQLNQELERRVQRRTADLQETHQQMEAFTYTVAHDLRAPLRALQGFSQALVDDYADRLDVAGRDYIQRIASSARRMDLLIRDLLEYSRLSRSELKPEAVDLNRVVEYVLSILADDIRAQDAEIHVRSPLPKVMAHGITLEQVLTNLLSNSLKFVRPGVRPEIRIESEQRAGRVRLSVQDNGIGIAPEHHHRVFGIFERLHRPEAYPGTGIGLAIVRKGIERLGGSVGLESEPGKGSRFWIELPAA